MGLLQSVPATRNTGNKSEYVKIRTRTGNKVSAVVVIGNAADKVAGALRGRFGKSIAVLTPSMEGTELVEKAIASGAHTVAAIKPDVNGYSGSEFVGMALKNTDEVAPPEETDEQEVVGEAEDVSNDELVPDYIVIASDDEDADQRALEDNPLAKEYPLYESIESYLDDAVRSYGVVYSNNGIRVGTLEEALRSTSMGVEDLKGVTPKVVIDTIVYEPCEHGHDDPDNDCNICSMNVAAADSAFAPAMDGEGNITHQEFDDVKVLPNEQSVLALPENAAEVIYHEGEEGGPYQAIAVPRSIVEDDRDDGDHEFR